MPDQKNEGLQAARAIAALTVAYFHSYIALRGFPDAAQIPIEGLKNWGYLGVNFFFAISGYVICIVASKPSFSPMSFAIKRLFRLYPMYWAAMAVIAVLILLGKYRHEPIGHFLYSMTLLPQPSASAYDVSWTLERELVFYALAASIVPFFGVRGLAFALAGLAWAGWYFGNPWTYHLVSTTQADFLAGVIVFLVFDRLRFGAVAPILVGAALLVYTRSHDFVFSVSLCMGIILLGMTNIRLPWERRPFRWLVAAGDASYSIYLLHLFDLLRFGEHLRADSTSRLAVRAVAIWYTACVLLRFPSDLAENRIAGDTNGQSSRREHRATERSGTSCVKYRRRR